MIITRDFKEIVQARVLHDKKFREGILRESIACMLSGDIKTGKALIRDYIMSCKPSGKWGGYQNV